MQLLLEWSHLDRRQGRGRARADDGREILRAGPQSALLYAAMQLRGQGQARIAV